MNKRPHRPTVKARTGVLPVIDKDGAPVATLTWSGTMWSGEGQWTWTASGEAAALLDRVRRERADLEQCHFSDMVMDANYVMGWQGFAGWFQSLSLVLPPLGLDVDDANIVWPQASPNAP
jgi:hypothetical protein